jgi:hypothetical protein
MPKCRGGVPVSIEPQCKNTHTHRSHESPWGPAAAAARASRDCRQTATKMRQRVMNRENTKQEERDDSPAVRDASHITCSAMTWPFGSCTGRRHERLIGAEQFRVTSGWATNLNIRRHFADPAFSSTSNFERHECHMSHLGSSCSAASCCISSSSLPALALLTGATSRAFGMMAEFAPHSGGNRPGLNLSNQNKKEEMV